MSTKNELNNIAIKINYLLDEYVKIHDEVFKFSWRRIIPLPFIFEAIDFKDIHTETNKILTELENSNKQISQLLNKVSDNESHFAHFLHEYCLSLRKTVSILKELVYQLCLKSQNSGNYRLADHKKLSKIYKENVNKYCNMGSRLNELYTEFNQ